MNKAGRYRSSISTIAELAQFAGTTQLEVLAVERILPEGGVLDLLACPAETQWMRISALRRDPGQAQPFCYSEIFLPARFADVAHGAGKDGTALYDALQRSHGIVLQDVVQGLEACAADANLASRLDVAVGSPMLMVVRHYYDISGTIVEVVVNWHPAGRYRYEITLRKQ